MKIIRSWSNREFSWVYECLYWHFHQQLFGTKYCRYHSFKDIIKDKDLWLLNGEKDSSVLVINRIDYSNIMQKMIHDGIKNKIHQQKADNTLKDLKTFQEFP